MRLLERPGHKILVNKRGEMLVQPSPMEAYLQLNWGFASWEDHVLSSYDEVGTMPTWPCAHAYASVEWNAWGPRHTEGGGR